MTQESHRRLISRSDLARLARVSPAAITKACKGQLSPACDGPRIDVEYPAVAKYLSDHDGAPTQLPLDTLTEMMLRELVQHFGSVARLRGWLKTRRAALELEHPKDSDPQTTLS